MPYECIIYTMAFRESATEMSIYSIHYTVVLETFLYYSTTETSNVQYYRNF